MLAKELFENVSFDITTFLDGFGPSTTSERGIKHSSFAVHNFSRCNRIDWYCFFDKAQGSVLLCDSGHPLLSGSKFLDKAIETFDCQWSDATLFLTHFHIDHSGNLKYCLDRGCQRADFIMPESYDDSQVDDFFVWTGSSNTVSENIDARHHVELLLGKYYLKDIPLDSCHAVGRGDFYDIAGYHLEVLPSPGHTPEHACLIDRERGLLVAGDHLVFSKPGVMQFRPEQGLLRKYVDSLDYLEECGLEFVLMSHHDALVGKDTVSEFLQFTKQRYKEMLVRFARRVGRVGPVTVYGLASALAEHYPNGIDSFAPSDQVLRIALMFGTLEGLHDFGLLERRREDNGAFIYFPKQSANLRGADLF